MQVFEHPEHDKPPYSWRREHHAHTGFHTIYYPIVIVMEDGVQNLEASLAHVVQCCVAANRISRISGKGFTRPGMHINFFTHGLLGFFHYQSGFFDKDFSAAHALSLDSTRILGLPCLLADIYRGNSVMSILHLASGVIPFALTLVGTDSAEMEKPLISANIVSLIYFSVQNSRVWGLYTAGAAILAYLVAPKTEVTLLYPLALALLEYCSYRVFRVNVISIEGD